jgi:hypothetical protein
MLGHAQLPARLALGEGRRWDEHEREWEYEYEYGCEYEYEYEYDFHKIWVASSASGERSPLVRITWPAIPSCLKRSATVVSPLFDESRYG